ncbi:hypothetical protein CRG98_009037 [Punica granatum]|uniref:BRCT domain-containing protein n=1 Tax=Punica granatum TaxID=22663 RepID=A0A2I0KPY2_PUNGR|nr:hypothetical protein CRG98_009037 [Punica granatum]
MPSYSKVTSKFKINIMATTLIYAPALKKGPKRGKGGGKVSHQLLIDSVRTIHCRLSTQSIADHPADFSVSVVDHRPVSPSTPPSDSQSQPSISLLTVRCRNRCFLDIMLENECDTEVASDGPFSDTEPLDLGFETELVDELENSVENVSECGAALEFQEEVVLDSEDEIINDTEQVDDVKASFRAGIDGGVCLNEAEMNQRTQFDAIPADECNAGEIAQPQAPGNEQDVVRPSYIGSCEPAELSEENALNFVENFLIFNNLNLSPEVHCAKRVKEGSPFFPGAKGIRDVAKRISLSSSNQGTEIFEWADTPQVVKHWDIMKSRRKEAVASANDSESVDRHSESVRHVAEVHRQKVNHEHIVDVNQHVNEETSEQLLSSSVLGGEIAETFDVGFCTQMAAEAMEALSRVAYSSSPLFYQDPQSTYSTSPEDERDKVACLDKSPKKVYARSLSKQRQLSTRRQGTSASSPKHPERQKSDSKSVTQKKVKSGSSLVEKSALEEISAPIQILKRLGISAASSSEDATHFVADTFARTRNMLEAIALGKPVVTHLWLESCAQAGCLIDERNFILRDARKEKELSFNMAASLANARQYPILKGRKVFITQRVKPSTEMLTSLVKAVHGQVIEKNQIPTTIDGKIPDEVLIISCEEDQTDCAPLLNKGGGIDDFLPP